MVDSWCQQIRFDGKTETKFFDDNNYLHIAFEPNLLKFPEPNYPSIFNLRYYKWCKE